MNNSSYGAHISTAHFGPSSTSTPSGTSSNVDSMSPYTYGEGSHGNGVMNAPYGFTSSDHQSSSSSLYLPPFQHDKRSDLPPSLLGQGSDAGDGPFGPSTGDRLLPLQSSYPTGRPLQAISSRHLLDDLSLPTPPPPPPRAAVPSFPSPAPLLDIPPPSTRTYVPHARSSWPDQPASQFDWAGLTSDGGGGAASSTPVFASRLRHPDDMRQNGLSANRPPSESSPMSIAPNLDRAYSYPGLTGAGASAAGPPVSASTVGEYDFPKSAAYPGNMYADLVGDLSSWGTGREVTGTDCGQALAIYEHILTSLPHLRPNPDSSHSSDSSLQPLLDLASDGLSLFTSNSSQSYTPADPLDSQSLPHTQNATPNQTSGTPSSAKRSGKEKSNTKCLGCGATETPEWRRGPMGPRTLCNACGLVHMKLQRKRKKQDEILATAKEEGGEVKQGKPKKAKKEEEAEAE